MVVDFVSSFRAYSARDIFYFIGIVSIVVHTFYSMAVNSFIQINSKYL